ncbi:MAG: CsgG/HfaB family protein [Fibrobacterota bacterium]
MKIILPVLFAAVFCYSADTVSINDSNFVAVPMTIAVLDFEANGVDSVTVRSVSNILGTQLAGEKEYIIVERSQVSSILTEQGFQQTGCTSTDCAIEIGKLVSAEKILIGSIDRLGEKIIINAKVVDITTGILEHAEHRDVAVENEMYGALKDMSSSLKKKLGVKVVDKTKLNSDGPVPFRIIHEIGKTIEMEIDRALGNPPSYENREPIPLTPLISSKKLESVALSWAAFGTSFIPCFSGRYLSESKQGALKNSVIDAGLFSGILLAEMFPEAPGSSFLQTGFSLSWVAFTVFDAFTSKTLIMDEYNMSLEAARKESQFNIRVCYVF